MTYRVDTIALRKKMAEQQVNSIKELAERSGVGRDTVSNVLQGRKRPSSAVMERFMTALNIDPRDAGEIFFKTDLHNQ